MSQRSSFVPHDLLETPGDFGLEPEPVWRYASSIDEALRLARAIDQHTQARGLNRWLRSGRHSLTDLAGTLGERPETLKVRGRRPAPEEDLILWSWLTGTRRHQPPLAELCADGLEDGELLPTLGEPARLRRFQTS